MMGSCGENGKIRGFLTPPPKRRSNQCAPILPHSERKPWNAMNNELYHIIHKVPAGDSPYVKAKRVQVVDRNPSRAVSMFWAAINAGDRVESALKDMAIVMKQLDRSDEAIEAIKSFRYLCPLQSQESLDNILIDLYKKSGRIEDEIHMLQDKIKSIEEGIAYDGKRTKMARSQGKRIHITIEKEYSRLLGNLAWAFLDLEDYKSAEEAYRKALSIEPDKNKMCNLAICLIHLNKTAEAKLLLHSVRAMCNNRQRDESHVISYQRASEILNDIEMQRNVKPLEKQGSVHRVVRPLDLRSKDYSTSTNSDEGVPPRSPVTQPRRCLWPPRGDRRTKASDCENWRKTLPEEEATSSDIPRKTDHVDAREIQNEMSLSGISMSLKQLSFGEGGKSSTPMDSTRWKSWAEMVKEGELGTGDENCNANILPETPMIWKYPQKSSTPVNSTRKKSWAEMVEEEELGSGDENRDANILPETPVIWKYPQKLDQKDAFPGLKDGYYSQPDRRNSLHRSPEI